MNQLKVVVLGPPSVGKGTYSSRFSKDLDLVHISTGDLIRKSIEDETELGKKAKDYVNSGELVPDELVIELFKERISKPDCEKGFLLDGFPRTAAQAEALDKITKIDVVLNLIASDEVIIDRVSGRRICRKCATIYHIRNIPTKVEGVCDKCGGETYQREDDKPEKVKTRLSVYQEKTKPLIDFYKNKDLLRDVDVNSPIEQYPKVWENVKAIFDEIKSK